MDVEHEAHLEEIKKQFLSLVDDKYRKGQEEHGGNLWDKSRLIDEAISEVIDLFVYLSTLKSQIKQLKYDITLAPKKRASVPTNKSERDGGVYFPGIW